MNESREELIRRIEEARRTLDKSIADREKYDLILQNSSELDSLIEQYIVAGYDSRP